MSNTQLTGNQAADIVFRGVDGDECEGFVAALEELAYAEGWADDRRRMLFFARSRLRNAALRWFARLDGSIKNDWDLFVQALFDQYPPVAALSSSRESEIVTPVWSATTFSPALSAITFPPRMDGFSAIVDSQTRQETRPLLQRDLNHHHDGDSPDTPVARMYDFQRSGRHIGRLRLVYEGIMAPTYIRTGPLISEVAGPAPFLYDGFYDRTVNCTTANRQEALVVQFILSAEPHMIGCSVNSQDKFSALSMYFLQSYGCYPLLATNTRYSTKDLIKHGSSIGPLSKIWNVLEDGTLQATSVDVAQDPNTGAQTSLEFTMKTVLVDIAGLPICFVKDYDMQTAMHPVTERPMTRARIVFEPL